MLPIYQHKASQIIKAAIKSAVLIDEKALEPFVKRSEEEVKEEDLSETLYKNFKSSNISLSIHKFRPEDIDNENTAKYLFDNRDLVLLDWKLDGQGGENFSLQLLSKIVERRHIHFCCIYTSEADLDNVFENILSYFSNATTEFYEDIRLELAADEEEILGLRETMKRINFERESSGLLIAGLMKQHGKLVQRIKHACHTKDTICALIKAYIAFSDKHKSNKPLPCPEIVTYEQKVVVLGNTVVSILKKDYDNDPVDLIDKLSYQIASAKRSFTQLLGLEMQNIFDKKGSFIDANLLEISKEAILHHRKQLKDHEGIDVPFKDFIKEILAEHAKISVRTEDLSLLDDAFLDSISANLMAPSQQELISMNIFYNSTNLKDNQFVSFGDVFQNEVGVYYLCITSVCDCLRPDKVDNAFYFVIGEPISAKDALALGDTAFTSFIFHNAIVKWTRVDAADRQLHSYLPVYIKPESLTIPNYKLGEDRRVQAYKLNGAAERTVITLEYVTTIKQPYAQRIANHTFTYPVRVGIDFVKTH